MKNIQLKATDGKVLYEVEQSGIFPDYRSVLQEAIAYAVDLTGLLVENENIDRLIFRGSRVNGITFRNCSMKQVEFIDCHGKWISFYSCNLFRIKFKKSDIKEMYFSDSYISKSGFRHTKSVNTLFEHCNLSGSEFTDCNLGYVSFHSSILSLVLFNRCTLIEGSFIPPFIDDRWMKDVHFDHSNMSQCDLTHLSDISMLYIVDSNIQDAQTKGERFTQVINAENRVLYAIDSDVVWWCSFRGNLAAFREEVEKEFPTSQFFPPESDFFYDELSRVCVYLEQWRDF